MDVFVVSRPDTSKRRRYTNGAPDSLFCAYPEYSAT